MGCKINTPSPPVLFKFSTRKPSHRIKAIAFSSYGPDQPESISSTTLPKPDVYTVNFKTLGGCKLGISRYPDFEYNAQGGTGTGTCTKAKDSSDLNTVSVSFDMKTLYIPPLTSGTTKFLGLPLPPFLKIEIVPELFQGTIDQDSGKVDLEFMAKFWFSVGTIYRAPPLLVKTRLTSEESTGTIRSGQGERLDKEGKCRLKISFCYFQPSVPLEMELLVLLKKMKKLKVPKLLLLQEPRGKFNKKPSCLSSVFCSTNGKI